MSKKIIKPTILSGFMELLPRDQLAFNSMLESIRESFELFGFLPIDTVMIEKSEILSAKSGGETEQQIYRFQKGKNDLSLRFDLTVPLARYVSQNLNDLTFPFRRYQIGKVFRGEKPQKGRFREFYQCDIDVIGKETLDIVNDAEIPAVIYFVFNKLNVGAYTISINNRKVLEGFNNELGFSEKSKEILKALDKIDKIGRENFLLMLEEIGLNKEQIKKYVDFISIDGPADVVIAGLKSLGISNETFKKGLQEIEEVSKYLKYQNIPEEFWKLDLKIARGLEYYTGTVYETKINEYPEFGAVCSGGRYDNLAEYYTNKKLPGVGISIGLTRLFYMLNENNLVKKDRGTPTKLLILPLDIELNECFGLATELRFSGIPTEVFTKKKDLRGMLNFANKIGVPYVGIIGEKELESGSITVKDMLSGEQVSVAAGEIVEFLKKKE